MKTLAGIASGPSSPCTYSTRYRPGRIRRWRHCEPSAAASGRESSGLGAVSQMSRLPRSQANSPTREEPSPMGLGGAFFDLLAPPALARLGQQVDRVVVLVLAGERLGVVHLDPGA